MVPKSQTSNHTHTQITLETVLFSLTFMQPQNKRTPFSSTSKKLFSRSDSNMPDNVFMIVDCPHDWLFPQCSAVVHHGGAGTTATGLKAGCPTTIVPFFGDQFFWGEIIYQKGLGPAPIPISQLTVESLTEAIRFMLQPEVKSRAMEVAARIEKEDGVGAAVDAFHRHLPAEVPLPPPSPPPEKDDGPNPLQWLFTQIGRICCLPCAS